MVASAGQMATGMAIAGQLLLCLPWVSVLLTPVYLVVCHLRHAPGSKVAFVFFFPLTKTILSRKHKAQGIDTNHTAENLVARV